MHRLTHDLEIPSEQTDKLQPIIENLYTAFENIRRDNKPRLDAAVDAAT